MRTNIREMPSCLENVQNLLWPHLNSCVSGFLPLIFWCTWNGSDFQEAWWQDVGSYSEKELLPSDSHVERREVRASSQHVSTHNSHIGC